MHHDPHNSGKDKYCVFVACFEIYGPKCQDLLNNRERLEVSCVVIGGELGCIALGWKFRSRKDQSVENEAGLEKKRGKYQPINPNTKPSQLNEPVSTCNETQHTQHQH
jgi:hypothetical protein